MSLGVGATCLPRDCKNGGVFAKDPEWIWQAEYIWYRHRRQTAERRQESSTLCGICGRSNLGNLKTHLLTHRVENPEEMKLLMNYGKAKSGNATHLDRLLCGKSLTRLDKHLLFNPSPMNRRSGGGPSPMNRRSGGGPSPINRGGGGGGPSPFHCGVRPSPIPRGSGPSPCASTPRSGVKAGQRPRSGERLHQRPSWRRNLTRQRERSVINLAPSGNLSQVGCSSVGGCEKAVERKVGAMLARLERSVTAQLESAVNTRLERSRSTIKKDITNMQRQLAGITSASTNAVQPLHTSVGLPFFLPTSPQKGEHIRLSRMTGCYMDMVEDFRIFKLARRTGKKDVENARQRSSHVLRFCHFMAAGLTAAQVGNLKFMMNVEKLRSYPKYLCEKGFAPTTIKNMLLNCRGFLQHVQAKFQQRSKLRRTDFDNCYYELKSMLAEVQRGLAAYRQRVLARKSSDRLSAQDVLHFMDTACKRIPELLEKLAQEGPDKQAHVLVQGYLMGYLALLTGHRLVVLQNLCTQDVMKCHGWHRGQRYMLLIDDHKTAKKLGQATVNLNLSEYNWLKELCSGYCCRAGPKRFAFHEPSGEPVVKAVNYLDAAWCDASLPRPITFGLIRSVVWTHATLYLSEEQRRRVAKSMCHDPATAERFYVALPNETEGFAIREWRLEALQKALAAERTDQRESSSLPPREQSRRTQLVPAEDDDDDDYDWEDEQQQDQEPTLCDTPPALFDDSDDEPADAADATDLISLANAEFEDADDDDYEPVADAHAAADSDSSDAEFDDDDDYMDGDDYEYDDYMDEDEDMLTQKGRAGNILRSSHSLIETKAHTKRGTWTTEYREQEEKATPEKRRRIKTSDGAVRSTETARQCSGISATNTSTAARIGNSAATATVAASATSTNTSSTNTRSVTAISTTSATASSASSAATSSTGPTASTVDCGLGTGIPTISLPLTGPGKGIDLFNMMNAAKGRLSSLEPSKWTVNDLLMYHVFTSSQLSEEGQASQSNDAAPDLSFLSQSQLSHEPTSPQQPPTSPQQPPTSPQQPPGSTEQVQAVESPKMIALPQRISPFAAGWELEASEDEDESE
ncbi:uncharacterized protein LOC144023655 [Festucalex cinctus]